MENFVNSLIVIELKKWTDVQNFTTVFVFVSCYVKSQRIVPNNVIQMKKNLYCHIFEIFAVGCNAYLKQNE